MGFPGCVGKNETKTCKLNRVPIDVMYLYPVQPVPELIAAPKKG